MPKKIDFSLSSTIFFVTDGAVVIDLDENAPFFEVPITLLVPEDLEFIP
jgi:hypothetical protein